MAITVHERDQKMGAFQAPTLRLPKDTFGQSIAKGLSDIGDVGFDVAKKMKEEADETAVAEKYNQYRALRERDAYGEGGWLTAMGENAKGITEKANEIAMKDYERMLGELHNESQRKLFKESVIGKFMPAYRQGIYRHESDQLIALKDATKKGSISSAAQMMVMSYANPDIYAQSVKDYDEALLNYADYQGLTGEARTAFIAANRGSATASIVTKMIADDPSNPQKANRFFREQVAKGRVDLKAFQEVERVLRPALEAAMVRNTAEAKVKGLIGAQGDSWHEGKDIDGAEALIVDIYNDESIPAHLKSQIIQGISSKVVAINALRKKEYADVFSAISEQVANGVPVGEIPDASKLTREDRNLLDWGNLKQSSYEVWTQLKADPNLTVEKVDACRHLLSNSDYRAFRSLAQSGNAKGSADSFNQNRDLIQRALFVAGVVKDPWGADKKKLVRYQFMLEPIIAAHKEKFGKNITYQELARHASAMNADIGVRGEFFDANAYELNLAHQESIAKGGRGVDPERLIIYRIGTSAPIPHNDEIVQSLRALGFDTPKILSTVQQAQLEMEEGDPTKIRFLNALATKDFSDYSNTPLPEVMRGDFALWLTQNRRTIKDLVDYDLQGAFMAGFGKVPKNDHLPDRYKKPNHPTFSTDSKYSKPGMEGGVWRKNAEGKWVYTPSRFVLRLHGEQALRTYFSKHEPDAILDIKDGNQ